MRILLAHNSLYFPSHGGGDKSNRLLMESLAERGHQVRVVTRVENFGSQDHDKLLEQLAARGVSADASDDRAVRMQLNGVDVRTLTRNPQMRVYFSSQIADFDPDIILTSTDDPGQLLFDLAIRAPRARVVYLVRATIAVPFGPDSSSTSPAKTANLRHADAVVGVSQYVANYMNEWGGLDAVHVPISLLERVPEYPDLGSFQNPYVTIVNPCAVKGIDIFLAIADRMPEVAFAAVPTWGATAEDMENLHRRDNIKLLEAFDDVDDLLRLTKVMLVPSVWAEARSRVVLEAMSRGVPVVASDIGGIPEAHLGVEYLIPIRPIRHYKPSVDANMVPVADVPPQDVEPWVVALTRLLGNRDHWEDVARRSRAAALEYAVNLNVLPFERLLLDLTQKPKKAPPPTPAPMSDQKRKLLAMRLKQRAVPKPDWFTGLDVIQPGRTTLFCFPSAGAGALMYRNWSEAMPSVAVVAARLPGRESRLTEPPLQSMQAVVAALGPEIVPHIREPFAFFGHSMGAVVAFELVRWLRAHGHAMPRSLLVSAARAPQFRLNYQPGPEPSEADFVEELRRLEGMPAEVLEDPELMRFALPAMRADANLYRRYIYEPDDPLPIPIHAYGGASDPNIQREHLERWAEQTTAAFSLQLFEGGHFYLQAQQAALIRSIASKL